MAVRDGNTLRSLLLWLGRPRGRSWTLGAVVLTVAIVLGALAGAQGADPPVQADRVVVLKGERKLLLIRRGEVLDTFWIALGRRPVGAKVELGDGRTPEGSYFIESRDANSLYYRALRLSYPNEADRKRAEELGVNPGGDILIHAVPLGYEPTAAGERMIDWTNGCIAVTNEDMDEIWLRVADGTVVEIRP